MKAVRRLMIIALIGLYAGVYTPAVDLLKLPFLLAHYQEHRQENTAISLLDFLRLHYFSAHERSMDLDKHRQLPFKKGECSLTSLSVPALPLVERSLPEVPSFFAPIIFCADVDENFASAYLTCIWQPPRA